MLDLPHFYTTHRDRLRKHLPEAFDYDEGYFFLWKGGCDVDLSHAEASIFLEHAARRVLEEENTPTTFLELSSMIPMLDTLFPPPQEPG